MDECDADFLTITLQPGTDRRIGWGDRERGYLDLMSASACAGDGYVRGQICRLKDLLTISGGRLQSRLGASLRVMPGEVEVETSSGGTGQATGDDVAVKLGLALLMEEAAMWVSLRSSVPGEGPACGLVLPEAEGRSQSAAPERSNLSRRAKEHPGWMEPTQRIIGGKTIWVSGHAAFLREDEATSGHGTEASDPTVPEAIAIASTQSFTFPDVELSPEVEIPQGFMVVPFTFVQSRATGGSQQSDGEFNAYIAWGTDVEEASVRAAGLAATCAIEAHRGKIDHFFSSFKIETDDTECDKAVQWAAFSGWSLVTRDFGLGIWAGLPWFRDNWGRDTFIALPGILLATGQFSEAREIIGNFARRQQNDPASPDYGQIPNRWRGPQEVIFNSVDGTLWFIREVWEYLQYTGDTEFALSMKPYIDRVLEADLGRCDALGFLLHGDADTWMDARIRGKEAWSPRGSRAVEVQALFYTALLCGAHIADLAGDDNGATGDVGDGEDALCGVVGTGEADRERAGRYRAGRYRAAALRLKEAFLRHFWHPEAGRLSDRLLPQTAAGGPTEADLRSRPNALIALTVPSVLEESEALLPPEVEAAIVADCVGELVYPYGVASLSQEDPFFHGRHDGSRLHHKDAAYHNGT
ncbi:MAG: hypothetical protein LLF89_05170, partial [Spirochaetaceae bacterium]|nr:hypothetical protein [Spirochaetaceae bacterium]